MEVLTLFYVSLIGIILAVKGAKDDFPKGASGNDLEPDNTLTRMRGFPGYRRFHSSPHRKQKQGTLLHHNEVESHLNKVVVTVTEGEEASTPDNTATTVSAVSMPKNERDALRLWVKDLPKDIFSMKNRMRLASVFLKAHTKDDVIEGLSRGGGIKKPRGSRHGGRRRGKGKKEPVAYHPLLRFVEQKMKRGGKRPIY